MPGHRISQMQKHNFRNSSQDRFLDPGVRRFSGRTFAFFAIMLFISVGSLAAGTAPNFTGPSAVTFPQGIFSSFTITTSGDPVPAITQSGHLPGGVKFTDNGDGTATLSGRPGSGQGLAGDYHLTFTATNGIDPDATQNFTLTISSPPRITSVNNTIFVVGKSNTFTVQTLKTVPKSTLSFTGTLPGGVTFVANNNSTATLSGTPAAGTEGIYQITITAQNGTLPKATQLFTLTIQKADPIFRPPAITSASSTTFTAGVEGIFTVQSTGLPTSTLSVAGTLPEWLTFIDNTNGTATILGAPDLGGPSSYTFTVTASNGVSPDSVQTFTLLVVNPSPAILSINNATFVSGISNSFTVKTRLTSPISALGFSGTLPSGVTFVPNSNGTATLSGTPPAGSEGSYSLTITASNGTPPNAVQNFTLIVQGTPPVLQAPAITSPAVSTFTAGIPGTFTVTTTGTPTSRVTSTGPRPSWLSFVDNTNGTATFMGTPDTGSDADYQFTITASNGVSPNATQLFVLTVLQAPAFTTPANATFTIDVPGSFKVETRGNPIASLTKTGGLPIGVTFVDNGDGTATIAGTPASGSGNSYSITMTAANGVGTNAKQIFSLTITGGTPTPTPTPTVTPTPTPSPTASASPTPTVTPSPTSTPNPSPTVSPTITPTPTATVSPSPTATPSPTPTPSIAPTQLLNISTRLFINSGENVAIGGFIITGNSSKTVLIRGLGPSLAAFASNPSQDPTLDLHDASSVIASNDDWENTPNVAQIPAGFEPADPRESVIVATLTPGAYTVIEAAKDAVGGIGLVEIYDLDAVEGSLLANISTRGLVLTGDEVMIGGLILGGESEESSVVLRALGPSLIPFGIANALIDPVLDLHDGNGTLIESNDNWQELATQASELTALGFAPNNDLESAIVISLPPGAYTAVVTGKSGTTGVALVEVYNLQ